MKQNKKIPCCLWYKTRHGLRVHKNLWFGTDQISCDLYVGTWCMTYDVCLVYHGQACHKLISGVLKTACVVSVDVADRREELQTWVCFLLPFGSHQFLSSALPSLAPQISRALTYDPRLTWAGYDVMESFLLWVSCICCFFGRSNTVQNLRFIVSEECVEKVK